MTPRSLIIASWLALILGGLGLLAEVADYAAGLLAEGNTEGGLAMSVLVLALTVVVGVATAEGTREIA